MAQLPRGDRPEPDEPEDIEAKWQELTARLGELKLPPDAEDDQQAEGPDAEGPKTEPAEAGEHRARPLGPRDYAEDEDLGEEAERFVPPEPVVLRDARPLLVVSWCVLLGGLALLLAKVLVWQSAPGIVVVCAGAAVVLGTVLLIWQLPNERGSDDDGAVV